MRQDISNWTLLGLTLALLVSGCVPAPRQVPTDVKKAADLQAPAAPAVQAPAQPPAPAPLPPAQANAAPPVTPPPANNPPANNPPANNPPVAPAGVPVANVPAAPAGTEGGVFRGRVKIKGAFAPLPPKVVPAAAGICAANPVPDESVVASADGGLLNVIVYLVGKPTGEIPPAPEKEAILDQVGCIYVPHAQVVRLNQPLRFKNSDTVPHNVQVKGFANETNPTLNPNSQADAPYQFTKPETRPVGVSCSFHGFMQGWILVVEHPWATVTDKEGNFQVAGLPDGEHTFNVWQEKVGFVARNVKVKIAGGQPVSQDFEVDASKLAQ